ncbi:Cytosolic endo-beta-N-acetylglucosaminidase [Thelohanellus kitauei]|uniref:Cytosolic endo-beta-N-acetylglucosaminidase n=1 Tax=Thelohanellus kitauei TaxID=669202 RepID=A0A0C2IQK3_THEKT|nr:Cytosolic endo-beta-N-acetylglucosaminidase [Thelohanellus kitauei]
MNASNPPISGPIRTLEEILNWTCKPEDIKRQSFISLCHTIPEKQPRVMICHDMMNGYHDDRFDQGTDNFDAFSFWNWRNIDVFVYFSHYLLSIPPFTWRVAAHRHNRLILATLIVEEYGINNLLYKMLSPANFDLTVDNLVSICVTYQFDGYLINFETSVDNKFVPTLYKFLSAIRTKLQAINSRNLVVWYDSIIDTGELEYQDTVNDKNV